MGSTEVIAVHGAKNESSYSPPSLHEFVVDHLYQVGSIFIPHPDTARPDNFDNRQYVRDIVEFWWRDIEQKLGEDAEQFVNTLSKQPTGMRYQNYREYEDKRRNQGKSSTSFGLTQTIGKLRKHDPNMYEFALSLSELELFFLKSFGKEGLFTQEFSSESNVVSALLLANSDDLQPLHDVRLYPDILGLPAYKVAFLNSQEWPKFVKRHGSLDAALFELIHKDEKQGVSSVEQVDDFIEAGLETKRLGKMVHDALYRIWKGYPAMSQQAQIHLKALTERIWDHEDFLPSATSLTRRGQNEDHVVQLAQPFERALQGNEPVTDDEQVMQKFFSLMHEIAPDSELFSQFSTKWAARAYLMLVGELLHPTFSPENGMVFLQEIPIEGGRLDGLVLENPSDNAVEKIRELLRYSPRIRTVSPFSFEELISLLDSIEIETPQILKIVEVKTRFSDRGIEKKDLTTLSAALPTLRSLSPRYSVQICIYEATPEGTRGHTYTLPEFEQLIRDRFDEYDYARLTEAI